MTRLLPMTVAILILGVAGCQFAPKYERPAVSPPDVWRTGETTTNHVGDLAWWTFYKDPVLVDLIGIALTNNHDLRIAVARMEEAAAAWRSQRSFLLPSIDLSADGTKARIGDIAPAAGSISEQYNLFGVLSYELDVWGRVRNLNTAAKAQYLATEDAARTVRISLIASVASTYFDLLSLDEQLSIAVRTLATREKSLDLTEVKFDGGNGIVSALDVRQAETQVYGAKAAVARLERLIAVTENALSLLLGRNPGRIDRAASDSAAGIPDVVPAGLPSDLLLRRPDVLGAEQSLIAENANIGAARAAYFPRISLTGALGLQSDDLGNLFDTATSDAWSFAPSATMPIFNTGRTRAGVAAAQARRDAALAQYEKAVRNAFREVDDAVVSVAKLREQLEAESANVSAETDRLELSTLRYDGGVTSYSEVLDAQRFLFSAELQLAQTRRDHRVAIVQLYKALGGGWQDATAEAGP